MNSSAYPLHRPVWNGRDSESRGERGRGRSFSQNPALSPGRRSHSLEKKISPDRHYFRMVLSPENAKELELESYTKQFLRQMAGDLETKLEWIAACHYNMESPHARIVLRSRTDIGTNLFIKRDDISRGTAALLHRSPSVIYAVNWPLTSSPVATPCSSSDSVEE